MIEFALGVAASIVAVLVVSLAAYGRSILHVTWTDVRLLWSVTRRLRDNGIVNFFAERSDYIKHRKHGAIPDYINTAEQELVYIGFWLAHGVEMSDIRRTVADLIDRGCYVEFIFLDPGSAYISPLADYLAMTEKNLKMRISEAMERMRELRDSLPAELQNRFVVRTHRKLITSSAFMLDYGTRNARILVDFKLYDAGRDKSFGIEFRRASGHTLYQRVADSLLKVRESAVSVA